MQDNSDTSGIAGPTTSHAGRTKRCAVCRIDLKGRFVYADDEAERLLGYTIEELFGCPLMEFLEEEDHELIGRIIAKRSHYETSFDSARVRLIARDGQLIPATVIMSLNFIAGSPVNFQLIVDAESMLEQHTRGSSYGDLVERLLEARSPLDWLKLTPMLAGFTGARQLPVYRIVGDSLKPIKEAKQQWVSDAGPLHHRVARTGEDYDFTSEQSVQQAVENDGVAPSEYVSRFEETETLQYVLRFVFDSNLDLTSAARAVTRTRLAIELVRRLHSRLPAEPAAAGSAPFAMPVIESLSRLGIGLMQIGTDGRIVAYNSVFSSCYADSRLEGPYEEFVERLGDHNEPEIPKRILTHLELCRQRGDGDGLHFTITLPSGSPARLGILTHTVARDDRCIWLVLFPLRLLTPSACSLYPEKSALQAIITELQSSVSAASAVSEKLEHEYHTELGRNGSFYLQCLNTHISELDSMLAELFCLLDSVGEVEDRQITDLDVLVRRLISELSAAYPSLEVTSKIAQLPRVLTCRNNVSAILRNILSNCLRFARDTITLHVSASITDDKCCITVADNGPGIRADRVTRVFDFFRPVPVGSGQAMSGAGMSLALTRQLVRSMNGEIELTSEEGSGTTVTLTIPGGPVEVEQA